VKYIGEAETGEVEQELVSIKLLPGRVFSIPVFPLHCTKLGILSYELYCFHSCVLGRCFREPTRKRFARQ